MDEREYRGCGSKAVFISRREAQARVRRNHDAGPRLRPYRCPWCGQWHLTSSNRSAGRRRWRPPK